MSTNAVLIVGLMVVAAPVAAATKSQRAREACIRGWSYYYESDLTRAKVQWERALKVRPAWEEATRGLDRLAAERLVLSAQRPYAQTIRELYHKGMVAYRRRIWQEAKEWMTEAVALAPAHHQLQGVLEEIRTSLGESLEGDPPAAVTQEAPSEAPKRRPPPRRVRSVRPHPKVASPPSPSAEEIEALYRQGFKAYRQGKREEGLRIWRLVLHSDPSHVKARKNVRKLEQMLGHSKRGQGAR